MNRILKIMLAGLGGTGAGVGFGYAFLQAGASDSFKDQRGKYIEGAVGKEPFTACRFERIDSCTQAICTNENSYTPLYQKANESAQKAKDAYIEANRDAIVAGSAIGVGVLTSLIVCIRTRQSAIPNHSPATIELKNVVVEQKTPPSKESKDPIDSEMMNKPMLLHSSHTIKKYICPLTHEIMMDPVIASDGCTYERRAILDRIKAGNFESPHNGTILSEHVESNDNLRKQITGYLILEERLAQNRLERDAGQEETIPLKRSRSQSRLM